MSAQHSAIHPSEHNEHPRIHDSFWREVSNEAVCIALICMLDLLTTLWWVSQGQAREGNPVLAYFLELGSWHFIIAKLVTFVPALVLAEWYRPRNPRLIIKLMRWVITFYVFIYVVGVLGHYGKALEFYRQVLLQ